MIKLSKMSDYAVVVLTALAGCENRQAAASALAAKTGLPEPTVAKILKTLARANVISSLRGAAGGYRLERDARDLSMAEVIEAIEGPVELTACVEGSTDSCALEGVCGMKGRWNPVNAAIKTALSQVRLADMVRA